MKTTKERLANSYSYIFKRNSIFYKTSLTGLIEEQVEKIVIYMAKIPSQRVKKTVSSKDLRIDY